LLILINRPLVFNGPQEGVGKKLVWEMRPLLRLKIKNAACKETSLKVGGAEAPKTERAESAQNFLPVLAGGMVASQGAKISEHAHA